MVKNYTPIDHLVKKSSFAKASEDKHKQQIKAVSKPKEVEPIPTKPEKYGIKEAVEHQPEAEVRTYIQPRAETIELPPDLKKMGLRSTTTTQFPSYQKVKLPISDDKILVGLHSPITSSLRWLAELAIYILKMAHLTLKTVHGKVIRVMKA